MLVYLQVEGVFEGANTRASKLAGFKQEIVSALSEFSRGTSLDHYLNQSLTGMEGTIISHHSVSGGHWGGVNGMC